MFQRQQTGSVVCPSCGRLVGVNDERCFNCGKWRPGLWGFAPLLGKVARDFSFADVVLWGCVALYAATLLYAPDQISVTSLLAPDLRALLIFGASGATPVFGYHRWWTVLSAAWLHGNALHIFFNLMVVRQVLPAVVGLFGTSRSVIIYTAGAVVGFGLTSCVALLPLPSLFSGASITVGASAPLFGLFGALVLYGQRTGNQALSRQFMQYLIVWIVVGLVFRFMDNWAHLGGFAGGYLAARWMDPLRPEKPGHALGALACLAATVLSIVASFLPALLR